MNVTICRVNSESDQIPYILYVQWHSNKCFDLKVISDNTAWEGQVLSSDLEDLRKHTILDQEEYLKETKQALSTDGGVQSFTYALVDERFTWKKLHDGGVKVHFGSVKLKEVPLSSVSCTIIDSLLLQNAELQETVNDLKAAKSVADTERKVLKEKLKECVSAKVEMEETLYARFVAVLNAKKERIFSLEERPEVEKPMPADRVTRTSPRISDDKDDPYGAETEEDSDTDSESKIQATVTSKNIIEDKLHEFLDADEDTTAGVLKKRVRGRQRKVQKTSHDEVKKGATVSNNVRSTRSLEQTQELFNTQQLLDEI